MNINKTLKIQMIALFLSVIFLMGSVVAALIMRESGAPLPPDSGIENNNGNSGNGGNGGDGGDDSGDEDNTQEEESNGWVLSKNGSHYLDIPVNDYIKSPVSIPDSPMTGIDDYIEKGEYINVCSDFGLNKRNSAEDNAKAMAEAVAYAKDNTTAELPVTLYIPKGTYKVTSFDLCDNVALRLEGEFKGSDYTTNSLSEEKLSGGIVRIVGCENVTIYGGGTINGNGDTFVSSMTGLSPFSSMDKFRLQDFVSGYRANIRTEKADSGAVPLIYVQDSSNVTVTKIMLKDGAKSAIYSTDSVNVNISNVVIDCNFYIQGADGITINDCDGVKVKHAFIACGGNGVYVTADEVCKNTEITDIKVMSLSDCVKVGSGSGTIEGVVLKDSNFFVKNILGGLSGIAVVSDYGATIDGVTVKNVVMQGVSSAFLVWIGLCTEAANAGIQQGGISNVLFEDIKAENVMMASAATGDNDAKISSLTLKNVAISYNDEIKNVGNMRTTEPSCLKKYLSLSLKGEIINLAATSAGVYYDLPYYGIYYRDINDLVTENITIAAKTGETRKESNLA